MPEEPLKPYRLYRTVRIGPWNYKPQHCVQIEGEEDFWEDCYTTDDKGREVRVTFETEMEAGEYLLKLEKQHHRLDTRLHGPAPLPDRPIAHI